MNRLITRKYYNYRCPLPRVDSWGVAEANGLGLDGGEDTARGNNTRSTSLKGRKESVAIGELKKKSAELEKTNNSNKHYHGRKAI